MNMIDDCCILKNGILPETPAEYNRDISLYVANDPVPSEFEVLQSSTNQVEHV